MRHARPGTLSRPDQLASPSIPSLLRRPPRPLESKGGGLVGPVAESTRRRPKAELQAPDEPHEEPTARRRVGALFAGEASGQRPLHWRLGRRGGRIERPDLSPVRSHAGRSQAATKGGGALNAQRLDFSRPATAPAKTNEGDLPRSPRFAALGRSDGPEQNGSRQTHGGFQFCKEDTSDH